MEILHSAKLRVRESGIFKKTVIPSEVPHFAASLNKLN